MLSDDESISDALSVDESISDTSSVDFDSMTDAEVREWHQRMCEEGDGWSHGFDTYVMDNGKDQIIGRCAVLKKFGKENWQKMGEGISQSTSLTSMTLARCELSLEAIEALFGVVRTYNCPFKELILAHSQLGPSGIAAMLPFFKSISMLKHLNLSYVELGVEGARLLSEALNHFRVDRLSLHGNNIGDEGVEHLLSVENSVHLLELDIFGNGIGRRGFEAISQFLGRDDTELKTLAVNCVEEENAKMLIDSISNESKLQVLRWDNSEDRMISVELNLRKLVCNMSSFGSLCRSNHQLSLVGYSTKKMLNSYPSLKQAFEINERSMNGTSVFQRLRSKLRKIFFQGEFDVQSFVDMNIKLMPYVLELVTRTEAWVRSGVYYEIQSDNLSGIYHLVRNCHLPELFSFPSSESKMQELEVKNATLEADIVSLEQKNDQNFSDIASLKQKIDQLLMENKDLRSRNSALPNKRTKSSDN